MNNYTIYNVISMNAHYFLLYTIYSLWTLKNSFDEERRTLLTKHRKKWGHQMKEQSEKEVQYLKKVTHTWIKTHNGLKPTVNTFD